MEKTLMEINLQRKWFTDKSTIGEIYYENGNSYKSLACYSLEDTVRDVKISGETAIPTGRYRVIISWSNRFKQIMPQLLAVPGFEGIRIHVGNTDADVQGCIVLGNTRDFNHIGESMMAYSHFCQKLCEVMNTGEQVWINIHGNPDPYKGIV